MNDGTCERADTGASPVICTSDLLCPEKSFPREEHGPRGIIPADWRQRVSYTSVEQFCRTSIAPKPLTMLQLFIKKGSTSHGTVFRVWCLIFN